MFFPILTLSPWLEWFQLLTAGQNFGFRYWCNCIATTSVPPFKPTCSVFKNKLPRIQKLWSPIPKVILPFLLRLPWLHPLPMVFCLECLPAWSKLLETAIVQCQQQLVHNLLPRFTFGPSAKLCLATICLAPLLITFSADVENPFFEVELQSLSFLCCKKLFLATNLFC